MAGPGPFFPVNGPKPSAPRYGLLKAARIVPSDQDGLVEGTPAADRVFNGVDVWPYPDDLASAFDTCNQANTSPNFKTDGELPDVVSFGGYTVLEAMSCTARSVHELNTYVDRVSVALESTEGWQVERQLWTGELLPTNPHLTDGNADVLNAGAATNLVNGLALLEEAIAASGRQGWIHATWPTVSAWSSMWQVFPEGVNLRTILGTIIVPGAGYDGSGPDGEDPISGTEQWAYATGPVEIRRSGIVSVPAKISEAVTFSPATNRITVRAERYYVHDWDATLQAAVLIDRCQDGCAA